MYKNDYRMKFPIALLELAINDCLEEIKEMKANLKKESFEFTGNWPYDEISANQTLINEYTEALQVLNASMLNGAETCPQCTGQDVFSFELRHSKCRDCDFKWTN